ncbi:K02A2.6-like [Cordylochernes scorpioides]|uniref:RNA-directed DNA polymerase n=1 Tax=Cordylochernes scorpioides TaxID=51811 RepID=A0ABY6LQN9_9ARAC|nr:K02A2.6-like [Cordylochernes scorpioides]
MPGHRKRRQFKQTDAFTRGMVIGLKRAGWSIRQIAADTHLGASTVHRLWRRWLEQGNVAIYRNVGATRVKSARVDQRILRQAVAAPQATCTAILQHVQDTLDHSISTRTISRRLVANGLHSCRPLRRMPLTPPNRRQRLEWCRARSTWITEWHRVVFSDESRFCLSSDSRRVRVWRRRGERSNPAAIVERPTVRQRGIMVWGAIAYDSMSPLLRIQGTMTAQRYVDDVLRPVTLPYLQGVPNALYLQDNARPHTARISQQALQDVQMLPWPPYSPDLSPIEHVWDIIGRRLHALPQPRSEDELWQMVEGEWRAIPQDAIRTLIDSLPRRVAACIAVRGVPREKQTYILTRDPLLESRNHARMLKIKCSSIRTSPLRIPDSHFQDPCYDDTSPNTQFQDPCHDDEIPDSQFQDPCHDDTSPNTHLSTTAASGKSHDTSQSTTSDAGQSHDTSLSTTADSGRSHEPVSVLHQTQVKVTTPVSVLQQPQVKATTPVSVLQQPQVKATTPVSMVAFATLVSCIVLEWRPTPKSQACRSRGTSQETNTPRSRDRTDNKALEAGHIQCVETDRAGCIVIVTPPIITTLPCILGMDAKLGDIPTGGFFLAHQHYNSWMSPIIGHGAMNIVTVSPSTITTLPCILGMDAKPGDIPRCPRGQTGAFLQAHQPTIPECPRVLDMEQWTQLVAGTEGRKKATPSPCGVPRDIFIDDPCKQDRFWQKVRLSEEAKGVVNINTTKGLFAFKRLLYGVAVALNKFQRVMDNLFADMSGVACYIDDILVAGKDHRDHEQKLKLVFKRLQEKSLRLNKDECKFAVNAVEYLGFKIDKKGLHPISSKIEVVVEAPEPTNVSQLRSFIGFLMYYSRNDRKEETPIAFASRTLTEAERRYSQLEKEGLSIIFGCEKFQQYLLGREFVLVTDNRPLMHIFSPQKPIPICAASRIKRWSLKLAAFKYTVEFRKTGDNGNADALSRLPLGLKTTESLYEDQDVAVETRRDRLLSIVLRNVRENNWQIPKVSQENPLYPYYRIKDELSCEFGCLQWRERVVIPQKLRSLILDDLHEMHLGMVKMKMIARRYFWWPGIDKKSWLEIVEYAKNLQPWHRLHLNLADPLMGRMFIVLVDAYTKLLEIVIIKDITRRTIIGHLREIIARFGLPEILVTDNGRQFVSSEFEEFTTMNGIRHTKTSPYNPSTNGLAERYVREFKNSLRKNQGKDSIEINLQRFLFTHRAFPQTVLKKSPAELLMKRSLRSRFSNLIPKMAKVGEVYHDAVRKKEHFSVGSDVYFRGFANRPKWKRGRITELLSSRHYLIEDEGRYVKRHINQLRPVIKNEVPEVRDLVLPGTSRYFILPGTSRDHLRLGGQKKKMEKAPENQNRALLLRLSLSLCAVQDRSDPEDHQTDCTTIKRGDVLWHLQEKRFNSAKFRSEVLDLKLLSQSTSHHIRNFSNSTQEFLKQDSQKIFIQADTFSPNATKNQTLMHFNNHPNWSWLHLNLLRKRDLKHDRVASNAKMMTKLSYKSLRDIQYFRQKQDVSNILRNYKRQDTKHFLTKSDIPGRAQLSSREAAGLSEDSTLSRSTNRKRSCEISQPIREKLTRGVKSKDKNGASTTKGNDNPREKELATNGKKLTTNEATRYTLATVILELTAALQGATAARTAVQKVPIRFNRYSKPTTSSRRRHNGDFSRLRSYKSLRDIQYFRQKQDVSNILRNYKRQDTKHFLTKSDIPGRAQLSSREAAGLSEDSTLSRSTNRKRSCEISQPIREKLTRGVKSKDKNG